MAERRRQPPDAELERALNALGRGLAFPPVPDLAAAVSARLLARPAPRRRFVLPSISPRRGLALAALALVLLATGVIVFSPNVRSAVADRLGLKGVRITVVATLPPLPATPTSIPRTGMAAPPVGAIGTPVSPATSGTPVPLGARLALGVEVPAEEARGRVQYPILAPSLPELGAPDKVYVGTMIPGGEVSFVYAVRPGLPVTSQTGLGLLLTEFRGTVEANFFGKVLGPGTKLEPVVVGGNRGWWIEGNPHLFFFKDASGQVREDQIRLAGNTLLWEQDGLTLRLESALSKGEALRIAESVRPSPQPLP